MKWYTVIGLQADDGLLLVAGVIEGDHDLVDDESESNGYQRWAQSYHADSPGRAEAMAHEELVIPRLSERQIRVERRAWKLRANSKGVELEEEDIKYDDISGFTVDDTWIDDWINTMRSD